MSKYYSINEFSKILGVSAQTLRNWDKKGKLHPHHTSSNGYRYYSHEQLNQIINITPSLDRIVVGYCRVSSNKQKDDLERQIENMKLYLTAQGKPFEIISDIGSGINYKKKGLRELIKRISQNKVEKIVVLYEDRLVRFGFELIEYLATLYNCEIEIIDNTEKIEQQELVEDLVQIITVFSCKLQGKRANKARKFVKELIEEEGEKNAENNSNHVDT
jgi:predicted site-specific integrase-resolvase